MKAQIIVNRLTAKRNATEGRIVPPLSIRTYRGVEYAHKVRINGCALLVSGYKGTKAPMGGSATIWIECEYEDLTIEQRAQQESNACA